MIQVKRDFMCLYCSELCHAFSSLEAVRKSHCELHYGDKKKKLEIEFNLGDCEEDALYPVSFY